MEWNNGNTFEHNVRVPKWVQNRANLLPVVVVVRIQIQIVMTLLA
jgi:hypothetical protein